MQITFLTTYLTKDDTETGLAGAQAFLLEYWYEALKEKTVPFIPLAKVEFKTYSFNEYEDKDRIKKEIKPYYDGLVLYIKEAKELSFEDYYNNLSKQYKLMELIITYDTEDSQSCYRTYLKYH